MKMRLPDDTQHVAIAGRTGSGKTWGALEMLSMRNMDNMAWVIIDHKRDQAIEKLPAERLSPTSVFLPNSGLHVIRAEFDGKGRDNIESFLERAFKKGGIGIYVDEGHLLGSSPAIRHILVAGRSKRVPLMWTSQRAAWIDSFIWSQASFYRCFDLQTKLDTKRFEENFPIRWKKLDRFHSYYYDVSEGQVWRLHPAGNLSATLDRLDARLRTLYDAI